MSKAEFFSDRLVRCATHNYKVYQKGVPTNKDCVVCALCRLGRELETSIFSDDVDTILKFVKTFSKKSLAYTRVEVEDAERPTGKPVKRRRRSRVSSEEKEQSVSESGDGMRTRTSGLSERDRQEDSSEIPEQMCDSETDQ